MAKYFVLYGEDHGGPESGPIIRTNEVLIEADSPDEASEIVIEEYAGDCFCGIGEIRKATAEEIAEYEKALEEFPEPPFN